MPIRAYYSAPISSLLRQQEESILGILTSAHHHALDEPQRWAWLQQLAILKETLTDHQDGRIFLELQIPRMGKRADAVLILSNIVFVIEFKVGAKEYGASALEQVEDYALDLKNFHEGSHLTPIVPVLVSTDAKIQEDFNPKFAADLVSSPLMTNATQLGTLIRSVSTLHAFPHLDINAWIEKGYRPTPTIVEAAEVLYRTHQVEDISRSDAGAKNLLQTSASVSEIIDDARENHKKTICFVTGVPGSGKTLAGLNISTRRSEEHSDEHAVFLSGNGPLVEVLREALARDKAKRQNVSKKQAEREVRSFIQNIHHFRDHYVGNEEIPNEKVVVFDEAQRAWTKEQASYFMQRKRGQAGFNMSEPEFLISVMDRHPDWCTVVCLVGGGQEINTGEAGISEWINALEMRYSHWEVYLSPRITLPEYSFRNDYQDFLNSPRVYTNEDLHLAISIRSFRAEALSSFIGSILDGQVGLAVDEYEKIRTMYPIYLTRNLDQARAWLRCRARGSERFGLVASSGAQRLRPEGIHVKVEVDPANWFLNSSADVRSSYYLEDVGTEFLVQGLELDWVGVCWDGDLYYSESKWNCQAFKGTRWQILRDDARRLYLKNAYRVLLTRARQGMVLFIPKGNDLDATRSPALYDGTFEYLRSCGLPVLEG